MSTSQPDTQVSPERERLRQHFLSTVPGEHSAKWNDLWTEGFVPWDRNKPNPALIDTLNTRRDLFGSALVETPDGKQRRKRALVPGCGKGYDVLLFASFGYDAVGLEASEVALKNCVEMQKENEGKGEYEIKSKEIGTGSVKFLLGDFFDSSLVDQMGGQFDVIYDYTFLCALPPSLRPSWSLQMSRLLSSDGKLICLEFPTYKHPCTGGPPWALRSELYIELFKRPGEEVSYDKEGFVTPRDDVENSEQGLERIAHWKAERTHPIGQGHDCVGIWRHIQRS